MDKSGGDIQFNYCYKVKAITHELVWLDIAMRMNGGPHLIGLADEIRYFGIHIIVVGFKKGRSGAIDLTKIASEGSYFKNSTPNLAGELQHSLCKVNCFCKERWVQYEHENEKYGSCLRIGGFKMDWENARDACIHLGGGKGHLATVLDKPKHDFVSVFIDFLSPLFFLLKENTISVMIKNDSRTMQPYKYHIGLSYNESKRDYFWEQPKDSVSEKISLKDTDFRKWDKGFPSLYGDRKCVFAAQTSDLEHGWQNEVCNSWSARGDYICQMNACDTDNYCP
ncbi:unnamed protein product [Cylicocyclus nassatus]|uniref:C-type lectin domain-containing protein n=1 Tax=Cylicocyclus nassatus TaxID=53992 RepID=A0AA36H744_CYLNA|nr:unnamed protein product [Cylicocyclus nassatus]